MTGSSLFPDPVVRLIAGVDEAGRGPLAGPVTVAAVILDESRPIAGLNDSKQLSEARREALFPLIQERALAWHVTFEPFDFAMVAGVGQNAVDDAIDYFKLIGPAAAAMAEMPEDRREDVLVRLRSYLREKEIDGIVALRAATWLVTARRA